MQTFTGAEYIKIAVANAMGYDHVTWDERIEIFDTNWHEYQEFGSETAFGTKDEEGIIEVHKGVRAYHDALAGVPTGYLMGFDATSSGIQIMAALSGCITTAEACNLVNVGERVSAYKIVATEMNKSLQDNLKVNKSMVKKPVMTRYYNSIANPRDSFTPKQLGVFYGVLKGRFPGAEDVMDSINLCWKNVPTFRWTMPDGFHVVNRAFQKHEDELEICGNKFHYSWTEHAANGNNRPLPANVVHSVDGYICREMVRRCDFPLLPIHDCFYCSPNNMNEVRKVYLEIMAEIAESDLLQDILRQLTGQKDLIYKKVGDGKQLAKLIRASEYAIC